MRKGVLAIAMTAGAAWGQCCDPVPGRRSGVLPLDGRSAPTTAYENLIVLLDEGTNATLLGTTHALDDLRFEGVWRTGRGRWVTEISVGVRVSMPQCRVDYDPMPPFDVMVDLYAGADFGASDMLAGAELLGSGRTAVSSMVCGARAEPVLSVQIPIPDGIDRVYLRLRFVQPGTTVLMPYAMAGTGTQSVFPEFKRALERIGQTESGYGRDMNGDGVFSGGLSVITGAAMGAHEHRQVNAGPPIRGLAVRLRGYLGCGPDINGNGLIDQQDVVDLIRVVAGGYATSGDDPDFNRDGNLDQQDVYDLIQAVAGGGCP